MIWLAIILFIAVLVWDLVSDYKKWLKRKTVKHKLEWLLRIALFLPSAITFANQLHGTNFIIALFVSYSMIGTWFWLLMDGFYNVIRGFKWWMNGSPVNNPDRSVLDDILSALSDTQEAFLKIGLIIITTSVYLKLLFDFHEVA